MSELVVGSLAGLSDNGFVIDVASGSSLDLSNGATLPAGSIVDVQSVLKTDTFSASVAGSGNTAVTDLSITHTLKNSSNKLLIMAFFGVAASTANRANVGIAIADDGSLIGIGDAAGSRVRVAAGGQVNNVDDSGVVAMPHIHLVYSPGDTNSHTYTVRAININASTHTLYVNQTASGTDSASLSRGASAITIQEVAA